MSGPIEGIREEVENSNDRRLAALLLLVLLVLLGAGVGTIGFPGTGPDDGDPTPTPGVVTITPSSPTPTPTPAGSPPAETATPTATPADRPTATRTADHGDTGDDDGDDDDGGNDGGDASTPSRVDLVADGNSVLIQTADLAPGNRGSNAVSFENAGDATGRLHVADATVVDHENSLLDPEKAVGDDDATGELSEALRVRLSVRYADGTTEYLFGNASDDVTLRSLDGANRASDERLPGGERATVTFEWELPAATGNEVQSDGVEFEIDFRLRQTT